MFTMFNRQPEIPDSQSLSAPEQTGMELAGEKRETHSESDIIQYRILYALENVDDGLAGFPRVVNRTLVCKYLLLTYVWCGPEHHTHE